MAKKNTTSVFVCQQCGNEYSKWMGQCVACKAWNSVVEMPAERSQKSKSKNQKYGDRLQPIKLVDVESHEERRFSTGMEELDRVFGHSHSFQHTPSSSNTPRPSGIPLERGTGDPSNSGEFKTGIVPGSVTLLTGEPGMGKSTLLSQLALQLTQQNPKSKIQNPKQILNSNDQSSNPENINQKLETGGVLYVCGEESPEQVKLRLNRLGDHIKNEILNVPLSPSYGRASKNTDKKLNIVSELEIGEIYLLPETNVENVVEEINRNKVKYQLVIVDSIQSMTSEALSSFAGSVGQVRECGLQITQALKSAGIAGILVGHVTKEGTIAGPKTLEHMVDGVFHLEGERSHDLRIVRSLKNRFGTTDEVGVFRMTDKGLEEVRNPTEVFLAERQAGVPGSVVTATLEGSRVMLLEVQALVIKTNLAIPRRVVNGVKLGRLQMILAVLQKQLGLRLGEMDVFVNVAGGVTIDEPAADLAIAMAVISSVKNVVINQNTVCVGELGLLGEIRRVLAMEKRIREANKLGYDKVLGPGEGSLREVAGRFGSR